LLGILSASLWIREISSSDNNLPISDININTIKKMLALAIKLIKLLRNKLFANITGIIDINDMSMVLASVR